MRFTAATAILVNTLPTHVRSTAVVESNALQANSFMAMLSGRQSETRGRAKKEITPKRRHFGRGGLLKNLVSKDEVVLSDCEPDTGILACGFGYYCDGNIESTLGGICRPLPTFERLLQTNGDQDYRAMTQTNETFTNNALPSQNTTSTGNSTTSGPGVYCDPSSPYYGDMECNCQGWNVANWTGTIDCKMRPETCTEGCDNTCYSVDFSFTTDGSTVMYQYCYQFVKPFQQRLCSGFSNDMSCTISVDDSFCTSCETSYRLNCDTGSCYSEACSNFLCENLDLGTGNSCYDGLVPAAFYQCYLDLNGLYPSCSLCSGGPMINPDAYLDVPGYGQFNCSYIDGLAMDGNLNPQQCTYATALAESICCTQAAAPSFTCNICSEDGYNITNVNTTINLPGQSSMSCGELQELATKGQIDASQCGIIQGFVGQQCGCKHSDDVTPTTGTPNTASESSGCAFPFLYSLQYLAVAVVAIVVSSSH